jgi:cyclophilin family peptidyl-prolyl cis-trans isomerase
MAREANARVDLTGLEDAFEAVKGHKNAIVGGLLVVVLGVAVTSFVMRQVRESAVGPWRTVFNDVGGPWHLSSKELESARASVHDVAASAYLSYWTAIKRFDEHDTKGASDALDAYRRDMVAQYEAKYHAKPIGVEPILATAGNTSISPIDRFQTGIREFDAWSARHPTPTTNPVPPSAPKVTIKTSRGDMVLALFSDAAPKSCEAFLKLAPSLKGQFIAKAIANKWIDIGQDEKGSPIQSTATGDSAPPFERNRLFHVAGAVCFRKPPFTKGPFEGDLHVVLENSFTEDERTTVFAQVTAGLEFLAEFANAEKKSDAPSVLAKPVMIEDVLVGSSATPGPGN